MLCALLLLPLCALSTHAANYQIVFKAGAHGTIQGEKELVYECSSEDLFPDEPIVEAEKGYVFTGWNHALPEVGSKVSGKQVYVAKYAVMIEGVPYTVRYVDEQKKDIATPKTILRELGEQVEERAKQIPGYRAQKEQQQFVVAEHMEILFIYTLEDTDQRSFGTLQTTTSELEKETKGTGTVSPKDQNTENLQNGTGIEEANNQGKATRGTQENIIRSSGKETFLWKGILILCCSGLLVCLILFVKKKKRQ